MNVMFDTCVVIDYLQGRKPFDFAANILMESCAREKFRGFISAKAVTDIYYIIRRNIHSNNDVKNIIYKLTDIIYIVDTKTADIFKALSSNVSDFEDAVMIETAQSNNMDCIITRNVRDFTDSHMKVYSPDEFIELFLK